MYRSPRVIGGHLDWFTARLGVYVNMYRSPRVLGGHDFVFFGIGPRFPNGGGMLWCVALLASCDHAPYRIAR